MSARTYHGSVRVALLDDHALVLKGLIAQLENAPSIDILGSFVSSRPFCALLATTPMDVALIDYSLAFDDIDGVALIRKLRAAYPKLKILVVSAHDEGLVVHSLLQSGADGFVAKSQDPQVLIEAIDAVMLGGKYVPPRHKGSAGTVKPVQLTPKEWEVIRCMLDGMKVSQIAEKFGRSMKTISAQKSMAYRKLDVGSDNELYKMRAYILALGDPPT